MSKICTSKEIKSVLFLIPVGELLWLNSVKLLCFCSKYSWRPWSLLISPPASCPTHKGIWTGDSQDHFCVWWFAKKKHKTQHVVAHMAKLYYNERIKKQDKQRLMGRVWRKPDTSFQKSSPSGGSVDVLNSSSNELCQCVSLVYRKVH